MAEGCTTGRWWPVLLAPPDSSGIGDKAARNVRPPGDRKGDRRTGAGWEFWGSPHILWSHNLPAKSALMSGSLDA
jgi:hypothetical protein